jgi:hypothetical protein
MNTTPTPVPGVAQVPPGSPAGSPTVAPTVKAVESPNDLVNLPTGQELNDLGLNALSLSRFGRLIVTAGPVGCGKTTLLTSLYEKFQEAPVSDYYFSGSETLAAFEKRCFFSRTASGRDTAETDRTPFGDPRYLHLRVSKKALPKTSIDLLFTDISGEAYERARDSKSDCQRLDFLKRADHVVFVTDCEKLVQLTKRNGIVHDTMMLLRSCLDARMLGKESFVTVLWARFDFITRESDKTTHYSFLESAKREFESEFAVRLGKLSFAEAAARPKFAKANLDFGHGLPNLLKEWCEVSPRNRHVNLAQDLNLGDRESEKFGARHFQTVNA